MLLTGFSVLSGIPFSQCNGTPPKPAFGTFGEEKGGRRTALGRSLTTLLSGGDGAGAIGDVIRLFNDHSGGPPLWKPRGVPHSHSHTHTHTPTNIRPNGSVQP